MQQLQFDFVSDLHIDRWPQGASMDWAQKKRSDILIVAGDIADDPDLSVKELKRMAEVYRTVLFIDGNHEHQDNTWRLQATRQKLRAGIAKIPNAVYLHDSTYIENGVAFVGRNGWWDFRFGEPYAPAADSRASFEAARVKKPDSDGIVRQARLDSKSMAQRVAALQKQSDVVSIVAITHTLPHPDCISWGVYPPKDVFAGAYGTLDMQKAVAVDTAKKIKFWIFGHNHDARQEPLSHATALSHPRGRPNDFNRVNYDVRTLTVPGMAPSPAKPPRLKPHHGPGL